MINGVHICRRMPGLLKRSRSRMTEFVRLPAACGVCRTSILSSHAHIYMLAVTVSDKQVRANLSGVIKMQGDLSLLIYHFHLIGLLFFSRSTNFLFSLSFWIFIITQAHSLYGRPRIRNWFKIRLQLAGINITMVSTSHITKI